MKRIFDIISSLIVLSILFPVFIIIAIIIALESKGGIFYTQTRVGKNGVDFQLFKFRSMKVGAEKEGQLTIGDDNRITPFGHFIRKTKLDEFPQLLNILTGDMSVVGPRPEVPKYVELYSEEQRKVLSVRPGLTDLASLEYFDEQEVLGRSDNPEKSYIEEIMPEKLKLNLKYIETQSIKNDIKIIFKTIGKIFK
jgi:lipopolysaccharide/colanic/teichoic acid biosynthesis glycosyltransferase